MVVKLGLVDPLDFRLELEHLDLRLALGEQELVVTVATLVRRQRQGCWDVYCTAAMGQVSHAGPKGTITTAARVDVQCRSRV